jgi:hypothetical protein
MLGTTGGAVLVLLTLLLTSGLGAAIGLLATLVARQTWGIRVAATDAAIAVTVAAISGYGLSELYAARGLWTSVVGPVLFLAALSVATKHVVQAASRARTRPE